MTQRSLIFNFIQDWTRSSDIERFALDNSIKGETAGRRCREMAREGLLERRINNGIVEYRKKPHTLLRQSEDDYILMQSML